MPTNINRKNHRRKEDKKEFYEMLLTEIDNALRNIR